MLGDLPGTAQIVLSRSDLDFDVGTAHHASGVDEAIAAVESLGADRAHVIGSWGKRDFSSGPECGRPSGLV